MSSVIFIFDLDNTLFETRSIPQSLTAELFAAMRTANRGVDAVGEIVLERAFLDSWSIPFPVVAAKHELPNRLVHIWSQFHQTLTFSDPLIPFPDVIETLRQLRSQQHFLCLLTSGYRGVQLAKIDALKIEHLFDLIVIDAVDDVHIGKAKILVDLVKSRDWRTTDMLIVGDSATSEIAAGLQLGIPTVQILRPGVEKTESAGRHILSLKELLTTGS